MLAVYVRNHLKILRVTSWEHLEDFWAWPARSPPNFPVLVTGKFDCGPTGPFTRNANFCSIELVVVDVASRLIACKRNSVMPLN